MPKITPKSSRTVVPVHPAEGLGIRRERAGLSWRTGTFVLVAALLAEALWAAALFDAKRFAIECLPPVVNTLCLCDCSRLHRALPFRPADRADRRAAG